MEKQEKKNKRLGETSNTQERNALVSRDQFCTSQTTSRTPKLILKVCMLVDTREKRLRVVNLSLRVSCRARSCTLSSRARILPEIPRCRRCLVCVDVFRTAYFSWMWIKALVDGGQFYRETSSSRITLWLHVRRFNTFVSKPTTFRDEVCWIFRKWFTKLCDV